MTAMAWLVLCVAGYAPPASAELLAGYEPEEATELTVTAGTADTGLQIAWPVPGGTAGVPSATEGTHVLRIDWSNQTDGKVEIRHDWLNRTFDLPGFMAGNAEIRVDVYIDTPSALPAVVGIWDDAFGWVNGCPVPAVTNEWATVSMNTGHLNHHDLNHIAALLFENLAGTAGTIYIDNLRLIDTREITFAGRRWVVKSGDGHGPGPNDFSQSDENVRVDDAGRLHLKITERCGRWFCAEIVSCESFGYGTYAFTLESRVDNLDPQAVLGLFTWDDAAPQNHYREIDFEFSRWGNPTADNSQYVIQPWQTPENLHRFNIDYAVPLETTTHMMNWGSAAIDFCSYYGGICAVPQPGHLIRDWSYTAQDIPPQGGENVRMNLWLIDGNPPLNGREVEIVVSDFAWYPAWPDDADRDGVRDPCDRCPLTNSSSTVDDTGCPPRIPGDDDRDGDVDGDDFAAFSRCISGHGIPCEADCSGLDLDSDGDIDQSDFGLFQRCLSGLYVPGAPDCAGS